MSVLDDLIVQIRQEWWHCILNYNNIVFSQACCRWTTQFTIVYTKRCIFKKCEIFKQIRSICVWPQCIVHMFCSVATWLKRHHLKKEIDERYTPVIYVNVTYISEATTEWHYSCCSKKKSITQIQRHITLFQKQPSIWTKGIVICPFC